MLQSDEYKKMKTNLSSAYGRSVTEGSYMCCKNCVYSVKMTHGWLCGEYAASIEPNQYPCERGIARYDAPEVSMAKMDS